MARLPAKAVLAIGCLAATGCAPWAARPAAEYVTVQEDLRHDSKRARHEYMLARHEMERRLRGQRCDLAKAEKHLKQALAADVRFGPAHHALGVVYFWQERLYLAAWEFEYAMRLMPDRFEPLNNLGLVYDAAGKHEEALAYYLLAREKAPRHPHLAGNLARASIRSGKTVAEIRPILEDVLAVDDRPEWRRWAADLLGLHPAELTHKASLPLPEMPTLEPFPLPSGDELPPDEELPLIAPPLPGARQSAPTSGAATLLPLSELGPQIQPEWSL